MKTKRASERIAIVGLGALFPGANTPDQFWNNLITNTSAIRHASNVDFGVDPALYFSEAKGKLDTCYSLRGGFIRDFQFDPKGYKLDAQTLLNQDRLGQWCLYVAREALKNSGYWQHDALKRCGVIMGNQSLATVKSWQVVSNLYADMARQTLETLTDVPISLPILYPKTQNPFWDTLVGSTPSALMAQAIGLSGPHYTLDAACASSLYAVKLACNELRAGNVDMMLAGAVSGAHPLLIHVGFSYLHAYPHHTELSAPLDERSNGLTSAEGAGVVVLKRLSDAERDGDTIHAVIEGVGMSNDGKGQFLLSPNPKGQRLAFEHAYDQVPFGPEAIDYLECHATGTQIGDKTELNSIGNFFGPNVPYLGSVKSSIGHLLTASGMASMLKVILAMKHRTLPATIGIESPLTSTDGWVGSGHLVRQNRSWPGKDETLRSGINAFGFGGTNAHLILSSPAMTERSATTSYSQPPVPLAIVGMDLHMGDCENLDDFYTSLLLGRQHFRELPPERWKGMDALHQTMGEAGMPATDQLRGAWISGYDIDLLRFKILPNEADRIAPQQMLMLKVADQAIRDAGLDKLAGQGANVAVLIAMETELEIHHRLGRGHIPLQVQQAVQEAGLVVDESALSALNVDLKNAIFADHEGHSISEHTGFIGNLIASRIASMMDFTGPAFTVSSNENSVYKALEIARNLLTNREVDAVVLGAVDLAGGFESVLTRQALYPIQTGPISMGWDHHTHGWAIGEGAGAIVLKRADDTENDQVYARLDDLAIVQSDAASLRGTVTAKAVGEAARLVLNRQHLSPSDVGFLEISASGIAEEDGAEIMGLTQAYRGEETTLSCALGSSKAHIGHTHTASGMASLIKTALSLYHRFLPGVPNWEGPASATAFAGCPFYVPDFTRPWFPEKGKSILRAAINGLATDGTSAHVLLSEGDHPKRGQPSPYLLRGGERLFPIRSTTLAGLLAQLTELESLLPTQTYTQLSDSLCAKFEITTKALGQTLVLVASSTQKLKQEIRFFLTSLDSQTERLLQTPAGSYYAPKPLGNTGKLALVYPGSGSLYVGAGALLFQSFPGLYDHLQQQNFNVTDVLGAELYPRHLFALNSDEKWAEQRRFQSNASSMMLAGSTFSGLYTEALQTYLNVQADSVLGYSLGETSAMWYSQGVWNTAFVEEKFMTVPLFREKVGGRMTLLAELWQLPESEARERWSSRVLYVPNGMPGYASLADWFRQEVAPAENRVFLTFINTDAELILSGDTAALDRVLTKYGLTGVPIPINNVMHHDFCRRVSDELIDMHRLPTEWIPNKTFYSSLTTEPMVIDSDTLATNALEVCCGPVDWPRIVRKLASDNHKLFIEVGGNATYSRWISEVLREQEHAVFPMDRKGASVLQNLTRLVAKLLAHGVPVNMDPFYTDLIAEKAPQKVLIKQLRTGGPRFESRVLTPQNQRYFSQKIKRMEPVRVDMDTPALPDFPKMTSIGSGAISPIDKPTIATVNPVPNHRLAENGLSLQDYSDPKRLKNKSIIWDETDLLTFATGKIEDVFGPDYAIIDTYPRRVMLPMPPYLLVSRVTKLEATCHEYKPSRITTEYDLPYQSAFTTDGQIPIAVLVESSQCDLLLISYLGIDFENKGQYVYRLLDCTLTFTDDVPFEGQTLRYDISIDRFVRTEHNLLFFFSYRGYVEERLVVKIDGGCAGFFSDADLALGQGVVFSALELRQRDNRPRQFFAPLLECNKTVFSADDLVALVRGDLVSCFGQAYFSNGRNPSLRLPPNDMLMLNRVTRVDRRGGSSGLGFIEAEKDLHPDDWYFSCHFRDDQVLAGSLQAEGGSQLLQFYMLLLGMQRLTKDARFQPVLDKPQKVRCRKGVPARIGKLRYQLDVKEIGLVPEPYVIADLTVLYEGQIAVSLQNIGARLQEKAQPSFQKNTLNRQAGIFVKPVNKPVLFNEYHITQFALGPVHQCFGPEYAVFEGRTLSRQPNTDLQLLSRVLSTTGQRFVFNNKPTMVSEYDVLADPWYYRQNAGPVMPYSILMEIALQPCGFLASYLGSSLLFLEKELFFRNLDGEGNLLRPVDLYGKTIANQVCLQSHTAFNGTLLQRYSFELSADGSPFYRGNAAFGFFTRDDLANQVGLDQGAHLAPWYATQPADQARGLTVKLDSLFGRMKLFQSVNPASPQLHLTSDQLNLLDTALIIKNGGTYGNGYVFARKAVDPSNWFFTCHFYQDPVMPGSLGVEAMLEALQLFALQQELSDGLSRVCFRQLTPHKTVWKYRGQILTTDSELSLELHIKTIDRTDASVRLTADASLWKGPLRIYTVTDLAVLIG